MRLRIAAIWTLLLAAVLLTRAYGLLRLPPGQMILQFPSRSIYIFEVTAASYAVGAGLILLTLGAFWGWFGRAAAALAGRLSRWAAPAAFLGVIGLAILDAGSRWGGIDFVLDLCFAAGCLCFAAPRRVRFRIARRLARLAAWGAKTSVGTWAAIVGAAALVILLAVKFLLYADVPFTGDGASSLFQARILAMGRLKLPQPDFPQFYTGTGIIVDNGWYSMYPPGHPLLLAIGVFLRVPWLVGPLSGAVTAALLWIVGVRWFGRRCAALAALLFVTMPHWQAMSASYMSHTTASLWLVLALAALCWSETSAPARMGFLGGFSIGMACATRPLSGLVVGAPMALVFLYRHWPRPGAWRAAAAALGGVFIVAVLLLAYDWGTTGDPLLLGYRKMSDWHRLGFGGPSGHTPGKGLFQTLNNLWAYSIWGPGCFPGAFVFLGLWWIFGPFGWRELTLGACWISLPLAHYFYYHQDFALAPRFLFEAEPAGALLAARGLEAALERLTVLAPASARRRLGPRLFAALAAAFAVAALPCDAAHLRIIRGVHQLNLDLVYQCRSLESTPEAVVFINDYRQGIVMGETLRHPNGPWFLQHRGEEKNRQFMAAHPDRKYYFAGSGWFCPYEEAPLELRKQPAYYELLNKAPNDAPSKPSGYDVSHGDSRPLPR